MAQSQHEALCRELEAAGAELTLLPAAGELTLDAVYVHDASLPTDFGLVLMRPGKSNRVAEARIHGQVLQRMGISILGEIAPPGCSEAGDMVWLDSRTLLVGRGYRTNAAGIEQMRRLLQPKGVTVLSAPLPHGAGPATCLHLMSLLSMLDEKTVLVDASWLAVETMELLESRGFAQVEIDETERSQLACNVLALGDSRLLALTENPKPTSDYAIPDSMSAPFLALSCASTAAVDRPALPGRYYATDHFAEETPGRMSSSARYCSTAPQNWHLQVKTMPGRVQ